MAAVSLFAPLPYARVWALTDGTLKLVRAPKVALVLGNGGYAQAPLRNPVNDANAIAETLRLLGFDVTLRADARGADMAAAVRDYVQMLGARKAVGLFYYAGHGVQLAWRNYMLPVDAVIDAAPDIQKQGVELNALMEGLIKAGNPMNLVIVDACRDNPFGSLKGVDHKGLSQMDAPLNTLLAYATSPGNVASDGEGANGLYTESLLAEVKVPNAKVEEIFKRVRLGVRLKSRGAQIPWESTSLEEDFWFIPPKELRTPTDEEKEKAYREQLELWEKIKAGSGDKAAEMGAPVLLADAGPARDALQLRAWLQLAQRTPAPAVTRIRQLEDFLRQYPTGYFAELAQLELDRELARAGEKKIRIAEQRGNPYTKGSAEANTAYNIGDTYAYRTIDIFTRVESGRSRNTIKQITDDQVIYSSGWVTDLLGNSRRLRDGRRLTPNQLYPLEFAVGKRWRTRYTITSPNGSAGDVEAELRITTRETITVPAGTFDAFKVEGRLLATFDGFRRIVGDTQLTAWYAPDVVRVAVATEEIVRVGPRITRSQRVELVSYYQR